MKIRNKKKTLLPAQPLPSGGSQQRPRSTPTRPSWTWGGWWGGCRSPSSLARWSLDIDSASAPHSFQISQMWKTKALTASLGRLASWVLFDCGGLSSGSKSTSQNISLHNQNSRRLFWNKKDKRLFWNNQSRSRESSGSNTYPSYLAVCPLPFLADLLRILGDSWVWNFQNFQNRKAEAN